MLFIAINPFLQQLISSLFTWNIEISKKKKKYICLFLMECIFCFIDVWEYEWCQMSGFHKGPGNILGIVNFFHAFSPRKTLPQRTFSPSEPITKMFVVENEHFTFWKLSYCWFKPTSSLQRCDVPEVICQFRKLVLNWLYPRHAKSLLEHGNIYFSIKQRKT